MKILGIDTSGMVATVAVLEDGIIKAEYTVNNKKTHSQTLLPMLDEISRILEDDFSDIDAIAVAAGPGSFTGLRIGSATVKGLAMAMNKPIVAVPTVEGLAFNMWGSAFAVCPVMDARRNQTYTGVFEFEQNGDTCVMKTIKEQCAVPAEEIIEFINNYGKPVVFLGDGVPVFRETIAKTCTVPYVFAPAGMNRQKASSIAAIGEIYFKQERFESATEHTPEYLRMSQAERERMEQQENKS